MIRDTGKLRAKTLPGTPKRVHSDPSLGKKSIFGYHGTFLIVILSKLYRFSELVKKELRVYHFSFVFSAIMKLNVLFSLLN